MNGLLEKNGSVRDVYDLELLGHWFQVDNVVYFININMCEDVIDISHTEVN